MDSVAQENAALQNAIRKLERGSPSLDNVMTERVGVDIGNMMIDKLSPCYCGIAFAFLFYIQRLGFLSFLLLHACTTSSKRR